MVLKTFKSDIEIIRERDPAARGIVEIFLCYPGFQSIVIHRFTHKLWQLKIPLIPRLLSHLNRPGLMLTIPTQLPAFNSLRIFNSF